jgi:ABC-type phosphate/phosphonate transport system ATPase subunit
LDENLAGRVLGKFANQAQDEAKAVCCVLHDPRQVERFANRVLEMEYGDPQGWNIRAIE